MNKKHIIIFSSIIMGMAVGLHEMVLKTFVQVHVPLYIGLTSMLGVVYSVDIARRLLERYLETKNR